MSSQLSDNGSQRIHSVRAADSACWPGCPRDRDPGCPGRRSGAGSLGVRDPAGRRGRHLRDRPGGRRFRCGRARPRAAPRRDLDGYPDARRAGRVIAAGEGLLSPGVTRRLIAEFAARVRSPQPAGALDELTAREREVVGLVAAGLSNDDIARRLYVSQSTVKTHVARAISSSPPVTGPSWWWPPTSPVWPARAGPAPRSQTR